MRISDERGRTTPAWALETKQDALAAMEAVDSYSYEMTIGVNTSYELGANGDAATGGEYAEQLPEEMQSAEGAPDIEIHQSGVVDRDARRMSMELTQSVNVMGMSMPTPQVQQYVVGDTSHVRVGGQWYSATSPNVWNATPGYHDQRLLENAKVQNAGNRTIDGVETTVIELHPDEELLNEYATHSELASEEGATAEQGAPITSNMTVTNAEVRQYVATETNYIVRTEFDMTALTERGEVDVSGTITLHDHDEDRTVDVPSEIEE